MKKDKTSIENRFKPMSLEEFHARIKKSEEDSRNGRLTESSIVFKKFGL